MFLTTITLLLIFILIFQKICIVNAVSSGYIENVEEVGTESHTFLLTCRHFTSVIAILEAEFTAVINDTAAFMDKENSSSSFMTTTKAFSASHPRKALNKRCSGVNHCSFILIEDCPGAELWGPGLVRIKYACVSESRIVKYCNRDIILPSVWVTGGTGLSTEGFIHNPGYPRLYSGHQKCRWRIQARRDQKIKITILDLALSGNDPEDSDYCTDHLEVIESSGQTILSTCKQEEPPKQIESIGSSIELLLSASQILNPRRGVLIHYTAVGCPTPPTPPSDGYLVFKNKTVLQYSCCVGFEFPDSRKKIRTVFCKGALWSEALPVPDCQRTPPLNPLVKEVRRYNKETFEMDTDLLPPIIIILILFGLNCAALFYIHRKKQLQVPEYTAEELGSLPVRKDTE